MKKILIVDDNVNNRMLLRAILEDYEEENKGIMFQITEAENGLEAVSMHQREAQDLIFMDIMMPEMDGIEATRRIRHEDTKTMIVAVSAVDDIKRQKEILQKGAEDYIPKPINADIFIARLTTYLALIESRDHKHFSQEAENLFTQEIYSRQLSFFVNNDDDLAEFWEYYLLNQGTGDEQLSDTVRTLYALGSIAVRLGLKIRIYVEEADEHLYFTMSGLESMDPKMIKLVLAKNPTVQNHKSNGAKFTIRIARTAFIKEAAPAQKAALQSPPPSTPPAAETPTPPPSAPSPVDIVRSEALQIFDYMDDEDLNDIKEYITSLGSLLLLVGSGDIQRDEVVEIATNLNRIGKIATTYTDSYAIGHALVDLANSIESHIPQFIQKSVSLGALCGAFSRDLMSWIRMTFEEGAPSVSFMNDTITSNAKMIGSMLSMDDAASAEEAVDLDDIFDF